MWILGLGSTDSLNCLMVSSCEWRNKPSGPRKSENFLTSCITVNVTRNTLRHEVNMWINTDRQNVNTDDSMYISCIVLCSFLSFNDPFFLSYWFLFHSFSRRYNFFILFSFIYFSYSSHSVLLSAFLYFFIIWWLFSLVRFHFFLFLGLSFYDPLCLCLTPPLLPPDMSVCLCACSSCHIAHTHAVRYWRAWWTIVTIALNVALFPWNTTHMSVQCPWTSPPPHTSTLPVRLGRWSLK
jgi:hypothetical protein